MSGQRVHGEPLYLLLNFATNLTLLKKSAGKSSTSPFPTLGHLPDMAIFSSNSLEASQ